MQHAVYEQVNKEGKNFVYSWLLGAPRQYKNDLNSKFPGWVWIPGRRGIKGCFVTENYELAVRTAEFWGLVISSNGSHAELGLPMFGKNNSRN